MPYTARYAATFIKPLMFQAIAIIQRDQAAAIALVNAALNPVNEFHFGPVMPTADPWMYLKGGRIAFVPDDDEQTRDWHGVLQLALYHSNTDPEQGQLNILDYGRVLDMILTSCGPPPTYVDWMTALAITSNYVSGGVTTPPPSTSKINEIFIEGHDPEIVRLVGQDNPLWRVLVNVTFHLEET